MKLLLFAAFPREIREAVRMIGRRARIHGLPFRAFCVRHPSHTLTVAETGLGIENATRVFLRMLQAGRFDAVISLGYCGALSRDASVGDLIWASKIRLIEGERVETLFLPDDRKLLETLSLRLPIRAGTFLTLKGWMKKQELVRFVAPDMTLPVCEMETFGLARLSLHHKLPFFAIRAVSDGVDVDLAFDPRSVCDSGGTYRLTRALRFFLTRPRLLAHALTLRRSSKIASHNLARAASALLQVL
jgi:nucleoside phosphorylase